MPNRSSTWSKDRLMTLHIYVIVKISFDTIKLTQSEIIGCNRKCTLDIN